METPEQYTVKTPELPEKIFPVDYAGFWDFSADGCYGPSLLNTEDFPNCGEIAQEISNRYNGYSELIKENERLREENKLYREALTMALSSDMVPSIRLECESVLSKFQPKKDESTKI